MIGKQSKGSDNTDKNSNKQPQSKISSDDKKRKSPQIEPIAEEESNQDNHDDSSGQQANLILPAINRNAQYETPEALIISPIKLKSSRMIQTAESKRMPDIMAKSPHLSSQNNSNLDLFNNTTDQVHQYKEIRQRIRTAFLSKEGSYDEKLNSTFQMPSIMRQSIYTLDHVPFSQPIDEDVEENVASSTSYLFQDPIIEGSNEEESKKNLREKPKKQKKPKHVRQKANYNTNQVDFTKAMVKPRQSTAKTPFSRKSLSIQNSYLKTVDLQKKQNPQTKKVNKQVNSKDFLITAAKKEKDKLKTKNQKSIQMLEKQRVSTVKFESSKMNLSTDISVRPPTYKKPTTNRINDTKVLRSIYKSGMKSPNVYTFKKKQWARDSSVDYKTNDDQTLKKMRKASSSRDRAQISPKKGMFNSKF